MERFFRATWTRCLRAYKRKGEEEREGENSLTRHQGGYWCVDGDVGCTETRGGGNKTESNSARRRVGGQSKPKSITHRVRVCRSFLPSRPLSPLFLFRSTCARRPPARVSITERSCSTIPSEWNVVESRLMTHVLCFRLEKTVPVTDYSGRP